MALGELDFGAVGHTPDLGTTMKKKSIGSVAKPQVALLLQLIVQKYPARKRRASPCISA
jgi:hypothetical protein